MTALLLPLSSWHTLLPPTVLFGVAPHFYAASSVLRLVKCIVPQSVYEQADAAMYHSYQAMVVYFFETFTGNKLFFYGDQLPIERKENVIYISNHQSSIDWSIANFFAIRQGSLGLIRYVIKDVLLYLPMFGPYFLLHGCIFVGKGIKGQNKVVQKKLRTLANESTCGYWLVIFPEGTRYKPECKELIRRSELRAKECGLEPFKFLLFPHTKAFEISLDELQESVDAVYDITLAFKIPWLPVRPNCYGPDLFEMVSISGREIHLHFRRIPFSEMPKTLEERRKWLYSSFEKKDKLLSHFYDPLSSGTFPGHSYNLPLRSRQTLPFVTFYTGLLLLTLATESGRKLYLKLWIYGIGSTLIVSLLEKFKSWIV